MNVTISDYKDKTDNRDIKIEISRHDLISLDSTLAEILVPALQKFRETTYSIPIDLVGDKDNEITPWYTVLDKMIWSFDQIRTGEHYNAHDEEWEKSLQEGFNLFAKYYLNLWI